MNAQLFNIGIFPWLMIAAAIVLYYPIPWPDPGKVWIKGAGRLRWKPEAPLKIIELSDYGCGYCRRFHPRQL